MDSSLIARWGALAGIENAAEPSDLTGLFQHFRPTGTGVDPIFEGLEFGAAVRARVRKCYEYTAAGFKPSDAYFIPRPMSRCPELLAEELICAHFAEISKIAVARNDRELIELVKNAHPQRVGSVAQLRELPLTTESPDGWIFDLVNDFRTFIHVDETEIMMLSDALYSIANNVFLQSYLLWPIYSSSSALHEPFQPYFELWSKGVSYSFRQADACRYFISPALEAAPEGTSS